MKNWIFLLRIFRCFNEVRQQNVENRAMVLQQDLPQPSRMTLVAEVNQIRKAVAIFNYLGATNLEELIVEQTRLSLRMIGPVSFLLRFAGKKMWIAFEPCKY